MTEVMDYNLNPGTEFRCEGCGHPGRVGEQMMPRHVKYGADGGVYLTSYCTLPECKCRNPKISPGTVTEPAYSTVPRKEENTGEFSCPEPGCLESFETRPQLMRHCNGGHRFDENKLLVLLSKGLSREQIADQMHRSVNTISYHIKKIQDSREEISESASEDSNTSRSEKTPANGYPVGKTYEIVKKLLYEGKSSKEICEITGLKGGTIGYHVRRIRENDPPGTKRIRTAITEETNEKKKPSTLEETLRLRDETIAQLESEVRILEKENATLRNEKAALLQNARGNGHNGNSTTELIADVSTDPESIFVLSEKHGKWGTIIYPLKEVLQEYSGKRVRLTLEEA